MCRRLLNRHPEPVLKGPTRIERSAWAPSWRWSSGSPSWPGSCSAQVPVFWAGPQAGTTYEFTETSDGSVYVRYLPGDAEIGDPSPDFLTVATYPLENGYARVLAAAEEEGAQTEELPNGGPALVDADRPSSVYLAYEGEPYQVEVYDPSPDRALELVTSGAVQPVR